MTFNSSSTNTVLYTNTYAVHDKPADTIEKEYPNILKMIKI